MFHEIACGVRVGSRRLEQLAVVGSITQFDLSETFVTLMRCRNRPAPPLRAKGTRRWPVNNGHTGAPPVPEFIRPTPRVAQNTTAEAAATLRESTPCSMGMRTV